MRIDWDGLLVCLKDRSLIPVVGQQLLRVQVGKQGSTQPSTIDQWLRTRLAAQLEIPDDGSGNLHAFATQAIAGGKPPSTIRPALKALIDAPDLPAPPALDQLAEIRDFGLLVSATIDPLLERALDRVRFKGMPRTDVIVLPTQASAARDLPSAEMPSGGATVFALFGRISTREDFALTEEDVLERIGSLQDRSSGPKNLLSVLRSQNLLLLGCGYPDWEARFFLRGLREKPFRGRSSTLELMVEATADPSLVVFLGRNSIQVYDGGGPVEFLDELFRRWKQREKTAAAPEIQAAALPAARASGRVFLSYASEDRRIVDKLADALGRADIPIWKDDRQLTGGDLWNEVIREAVSRCELFVPCISHSTTSQAESYFYGEWNLALDRSRNLAPDEKFIFPVTLDDTPIDDPRVALFKHLQWTRLDDQGWDAQVQELARALDLAMRARREQAAGYR